MSQSDEHRALVLSISQRLVARHPGISITQDLQASPGDPVPPLIDGFRPDVYARLSGNGGSVIIAEAKTRRDIWNAHTRSQAHSFISHLEATQGGRFILCAAGRGADQAKTLLRFLVWKAHPCKVSVQVFDGCDFWTLDPRNGVVWHLD